MCEIQKILYCEVDGLRILFDCNCLVRRLPCLPSRLDRRRTVYKIEPIYAVTFILSKNVRDACIPLNLIPTV